MGRWHWPSAVAAAPRTSHELQIHLIPDVLGDGRRLFGADHRAPAARILDTPDVTHLRYRVGAPAGRRLIRPIPTCSIPAVREARRRRGARFGLTIGDRVNES